MTATGTGETLHMSQQEKSPLWIQSSEETSRVWIHGSRFSVPVPYYTQLKHTHTHTLKPDECVAMNMECVSKTWA